MRRHKNATGTSVRHGGNCWKQAPELAAMRQYAGQPATGAFGTMGTYDAAPGLRAAAAGAAAFAASGAYTRSVAPDPGSYPQ